MIGGLTREVRWRDAFEAPPQKTGYVIAAYFTPDGETLAREAYWDGREFSMSAPPFKPLRGVTHWMPYPARPANDEMRRVARKICLTVRSE